MRKSLKKSLANIPLEEAHGGSGLRQVVFLKEEVGPSNFEAVTKGFLNQGKKYEIHKHEQVDEIFVVLKGSGKVRYFYSDNKVEEFEYKEGDFFYNVADVEHEIESLSEATSEFYFIRFKAV
ncbi:MAG: cupin domain-containing protein [bacterium]